jgi:predicted metalloenzyme YecM
MNINSQSSNPEQPKQFWQVLIQKCQIALQNSEVLKVRLSLIKLKEPGIRTQAAFWELCSSFIQVRFPLHRTFPISTNKSFEVVHRSSYESERSEERNNLTTNGGYHSSSPASESHQGGQPAHPSIALVIPSHAIKLEWHVQWVFI